MLEVYWLSGMVARMIMHGLLGRIGGDYAQDRRWPDERMLGRRNARESSQDEDLPA